MKKTLLSLIFIVTFASAGEFIKQSNHAISFNNFHGNGLGFGYQHDSDNFWNIDSIKGFIIGYNTAMDIFTYRQDYNLGTAYSLRGDLKLLIGYNFHKIGLPMMLKAAVGLQTGIDNVDYIYLSGTYKISTEYSFDKNLRIGLQYKNSDTNLLAPNTDKSLNFVSIYFSFNDIEEKK